MYQNLYNIRIPLVKRIDTLRKKLLVPHANDIRQQEFLHNIFNRKVILNKNRNTHPHMVLAQIRRQFEFEVTLEMFPSTIVDIGAGVRSQLYGLSHVYNIQPILSTADRLRQNKRRRMVKVDPMLARWTCECDFERCTHIAHSAESDQFKPDIYLSIDSSYYGNVLDHITHLVKIMDAQAFLAFHVFDPSLTGKHDIIVAGTKEGSFEISEDGKQVKMLVNGNPCAYSHPIHELNSMYYHSAVVYKGCFFAVQKVADFGNSKYLLVQCVKADDGIIADYPNVTSTMHNKMKEEKQVVEEKQGTDNLTELITEYDLSAMQNGAYYKLSNGKSTTYYRVVNAKLQSATVITQQYDEVKLSTLEYKDLVPVVDLNRVVTKLLLKQGPVNYDDIIGSYICIMSGKNIDMSALTSIVVAAVSQTRKLMENAISIMNSEDINYVNKYKSKEYTYVKSYVDIIYEYINRLFIFIKYKFIIPTVFILIGLLLSYVMYKILDFIGLNDFCIDTVKDILQYMYSYLEFIIQQITPRIYVVAMTNKTNKTNSVVVDLAATYLTSLFGKETLKFLSKHFPRRTIKTSCISKDNYPEVNQPLHNGKYEGKDTVEWNLKIPHNLTEEEFLKLNCGENKPGLVQVMPELQDAEEPIIYHVCSATNYCAAKRQVTVVPKPDDIMVNRFALWFEKIFENEIEPLVDKFSYSLEDWISHLDCKKQTPMLQIRAITQDILDYESFKSKLSLIGEDADTNYEMFVKSEKQLYSDGKAPKNRCICSPNNAHKFVMGPICWKLEHLFSKFKGYCGGASWNDLERVYDSWEARGLGRTIQLDGSGFDRTQHQVLKDIVDKRIYSHISKYVNHVPEEVFLHFAMAETRLVKVKSQLKFRNKISKISDGCFSQTGAVFSGSCDTTLMNTLRMALYNRFVCEELCKLEWGTEYEVKSKGDDTVTVLNYNIEVDYVLNNYQRVFVYDKKSEEYPNLYHGLGQIAKYFKVGFIEDIDFCSTETVYCPRMGGYKIMRQLKRFLTTTVWSRKAKNFTKEQMLVYLESLYQANLTWMNGLPIFRVFNAYLHKDCTGLEMKTKTGKQKITMEGQDLLTSIDYNAYYESDYKFSLHINTETKVPHEQDMIEYFCRKYNWHWTDIYQIELQLSKANLSNWQIFCPLLAEITH